MKKFYSITAVLIMISMMLLTSCEKDQATVEAELVAIPITMSLSDFRAAVKIVSPRPVKETGKIYSYKELVFINDVNRGIHVIDNSDPSAPEKISYIHIPQNTDLSVKDDKLFANSGKDLVVFDISNPQNIQQHNRLENVFEYYQPFSPMGAAYVDTQHLDPEHMVITGYVLEERKFDPDRPRWFLTDRVSFNSGDSAESATGTGGSMARFNIRGNHLYVVGPSLLSVFDMADLSAPEKISDHYAGWQIETIFNQGEYLYLGSSRGMFIYSIEDPASPTFVSVLEHVLGCDPVVVDQDTAYVTIRGGNECGQPWSQLDVIDVSNKSHPQLLKSYEMDSPYGLGVKDDLLFVCDGDSGLKIFDRSNGPELELIDHFKDIKTYDVIPLDHVLLLIGEQVLRQYTYQDNQISLLSAINLD